MNVFKKMIRDGETESLRELDQSLWNEEKFNGFRKRNRGGFYEELNMKI